MDEPPPRSSLAGPSWFTELSRGTFVVCIASEKKAAATTASAAPPPPPQETGSQGGAHDLSPVPRSQRYLSHLKSYQAYCCSHFSRRTWRRSNNRKGARPLLLLISKSLNHFFPPTSPSPTIGAHRPDVCRD